MPYANNNDVKLYYEAKGQGCPPLLMISGLGSNRLNWPKKLTDKLSANFKLIFLDNRGIGKSVYKGSAFSVKDFADDAYAVLKSIKAEKANVLGISLGGFIAQELCIRYPDAVNKLVLVSTHFGGESRIKPDVNDIGKMFSQPNLSEEENIKRKAEIMYSSIYSKRHTAYIKDYFAKRERLALSEKNAVIKQAQAGRSFKSENRLFSLDHDVLILQGEDDRIVKCANGQLLKNKIKNAKLKIYKNTGHMLLHERPYNASRDILNFLNKKPCLK
jgi:pimeloyl-ACP methyl ester carboxylesterase